MSHKTTDILSLLLTDFSKYTHVDSFFLSISFSSSFFVLYAGPADNHCYKPITHINHSNSQVFCFKIWLYGQISSTHLRGPLSFIFKFLSFLMAFITFIDWLFKIYTCGLFLSPHLFLFLFLCSVCWVCWQSLL